MTLTSEPRGTAGIGWDGRRLEEMLQRSEELLAETGRYQGLSRLELKESDPIGYEKMFGRMRGGVVTARETVKRIAASPMIEELGELCFALYSPEGDCLALSTGIIVHVHTMSAAIKHMIRSGYEDNPGIADGDIFVNNDPHIGDVHNADVQTLVPIFHEGELLGWAAGVTHEIDVGARTPGGIAVGPLNRFEDGIDLPALKCGADDTLFHDYVERCKKATRTPLYWTLDEKTRIAGCHMIRDVVRDLVTSEGVGLYKQFIRELVEEGRRTFLGRVREQLVPGKYRTPAFVDFQFGAESSLPADAAVDGILHSPLEMEVRRDGSLSFDLAGANQWGLHSFNATPVAFPAGAFLVLAQTIMANDKLNEGAMCGLEISIPEGSWGNPGHELTSHSHAWHLVMPTAIALGRLLARGLYARGLVEEVFAGWGQDANNIQGGAAKSAHEADGAEVAVHHFEVACIGAGAGVVRDGLDFACAPFNPQGDMGDIEDWELLQRILYLGRERKPGSAGLGRRRGGSGFTSLRLVPGDYDLQNVGDGAVFSQSGIFGGYPGAAGYRHNLHGTNLEQVFEGRLPYPTGEQDTAEPGLGELEHERRDFDMRGVTMLERFRAGDLYLDFLRGGPGLGDPLDREPEDVVADLETGAVLPRFAASVCGVVANERDGRFELDREATRRRREEMREERRQRAIPVSEWIEGERRRVLDRDFIPPVTRMYRSAMELSPDWARSYRDFWGLQDDFEY